MPETDRGTTAVHRLGRTLITRLSVILVVTLATAACGDEGQRVASRDDGDHPMNTVDHPGESHGYDEVFLFDEPSVRKYSAVVGVVSVVDEVEHPLPADAPPDAPVESLRDLDVQIVTPISGARRGETLRVLDIEGYQYSGDGTRSEVPSKARLRVGDRAFVVLVREAAELSQQPAYLLLTQDSFVVLENGEAVESGRSGEFVRELEKLSEEALVDRAASFCRNACDATEFPQFES